MASGRRIAVVIPTYNRAHVLGACLDSVLEQTVAADEVIVVDDGSSDRTAELLAGYGDRIRAIRQPNGGVSRARNAGIAAATAEWVAFVDSDDLWRPTRIEVLHRDLTGAPPEIGVHVADLLLTGEDYAQSMFALHGFGHPIDRAVRLDDPMPAALAAMGMQASAARRDWLHRAGLFDPDLRSGEDTDLMCRMAVLGPWLITGAEVAEVRRLPGDQGALVEQERRDQIRARSDRARYLAALRDLALTPAQDRLVGKVLNHVLLLRAEAELLDGAPWRQSVLAAARAHPSALKGWLKAVPPLIAGRAGFRFVFGEHRGFRRS
ncbi:MAG: glycosyltransferase family 2 protein [Paracoccaceae bacterium]